MDFSEYIFPIIGLLIWLVSNLFNKKKDPEDSEPTPMEAPRPVAGNDDPLRSIQEEIRRLARERREKDAARESESSAPTTVSPLSPTERHYELDVPQDQHKQTAHEFKNPEVIIEEPMWATEKKAHSLVESNPIQWDIPPPEVSSWQPIRKTPANVKNSNKSLLSKDINATLRTQRGKKKAFLMSEILLPPLALRTPSSHLWN